MLYKFIKYLKSIGYKEIRNFNNDSFVYKTTYEFDSDIEIERSDDDIYVYGWVIEMKYPNSETWRLYWNNKIYSSKEIALDAINQSVYRSSGDMRVKALYGFKNNGWRNYIINKIIKSE
jgi:hypothetical protein